jgi:succinate dehydrogenase / fumarate reductase membrane anchor subunit
MVGEGVKAIDFAFVAGKWATPFWQYWDLAMLWLALIHGANGMRTIVNDYSSSVTLGKVLRGAIYASAAILIVLGTLVIFTFDPCPSVSPEQLGLLPSFCPPQ